MDVFTQRRTEMVEQDLAARGLRDERVLEAMKAVPRHLFLPRALAEQAYRDEPQPLPKDQTISQPYIVGLMCEAARLKPTDKVLEIGTGSGYSAAVTARLCAQVFSIERHPQLATQALQTLALLGCENVSVICGDGTLGWAEHAPYDAIIVTAGGPVLPPALLDQLAPQGRLVIPLGPPKSQKLLRVTRLEGDEFTREELLDVRFVPLIGAQGWNSKVA